MTISVIDVCVSVWWYFRYRRNKFKEKPSVDYEIPEVNALITPTIHLEHNAAYGKVSFEMTENTPSIPLEHNISYGKVSFQH